MKNNMKKNILCGLSLMAAALFSACGDGDRIDQTGGLPIPQKVEVTEVKPIAGGAVIKVKIPDDPILKGVVATYNRNGEIVNARISRYLDSLVVEGYGEVTPQQVQIRSFNADNGMSEPQIVEFTPQTPTIKKVDFTIHKTFGGIKIHVTGNDVKADLAVVIRVDTKDPDKEMAYTDRAWKDVTTLFTETDDVWLVRRGMESVPSVFAVYMRDHWGNVSEVKMEALTPLFEQQLDKSKFSYKAGQAYSAYDNVVLANSSKYYPIQRLWDGSGSSAYNSSYGYYFFATDDGPMPSWVTIDLGQEASLSRIGLWPRQSYFPYQQGAVRKFEFWGALNPTGNENVAGNEHGFGDEWVKLGEFEWAKPSGYLPDGNVGEISQEDITYYNFNGECELDPDTGFPHAWDKIRYLRIVAVCTFATWETGLNHGGWYHGEITPYGQLQE